MILASKNESNCLNAWEIQQHRVYSLYGVAPPISSAQKRYGGFQCLILVEIDANEQSDKGSDLED